MVDYEKIKLVIWDMDDTFWIGTLSEGEVSVPAENVELIKNLTDIGIVNAICSKNYDKQVEAELVKCGIWEYFVFNSINWNAKGARIKNLINSIQLRQENVLFIDDNHMNLEEAKFFCPKLMVADPVEVINGLIEFACKSEKKDVDHARLEQYKVLEEKNREKSAYGSNEDFLMSSNIKLEVKHDCLEHIDRIHDLVLRSNQLNFTKKRSSIEELKGLFCDKNINSGYVSVRDRFGEYGITGFYAMKKKHLLHFVFSCRTLGMGIEQYMYNYLGRPELEVVGEVISDLSSKELPKWINTSKSLNAVDKMHIENLKEHMVLIKGPCDLFQIYPYIENTDMFDTEFSHTTDNGIYIESTSHTSHMVDAIRLSKIEKQRVIDEVPFVDSDIYSDKMYTGSYKVVFVSILTDPNLGVYRRKTTGERIAFVEYTQPITNPENWDDLIHGRIQTNNFSFTYEILEEFAKNWEFVGRNTPTQVLENLKYIREHMRQDCVLGIMLGGELYYEKNKIKAYEDRHIIHRQINELIREWALHNENVRVIDVNKYLTDQSCFYDHFNHYIKPIYYKLAQEIVSIVNECTGSRVREKSKLTMIQIRIKEILAPLYYKVRSVIRK